MTGPENARSTTGSWIWDGDGRRPFPLRETAFCAGQRLSFGSRKCKIVYGSRGFGVADNENRKRTLMRL